MKRSELDPLSGYGVARIMVAAWLAAFVIVGALRREHDAKSNLGLVQRYAAEPVTMPERLVRAGDFGIFAVEDLRRANPGAAWVIPKGARYVTVRLYSGGAGGGGGGVAVGGQFGVGVSCYGSKCPERAH